MEGFGSLPSHPLRRSEVERLRSDASVDGLIELEPKVVYRNGGLRKAVALTDRTVIDLAFRDGTWTQQVLARDADSRHHLREALKQLNETNTDE
ncbi:hypothetical protein [Halococcus hamelinensis]|uniref:DUF7964 domain-containing protein n=1 Tax=Halococcus hamelinensis 100A6 TaxID=1132509 RepID=M0LW58_9EURY|nr:hypothetical protein [Halococcus hamelinensis]EMA37701.1 hypothetical protein C447_12035 [Halococcus hamelinensis 100A6]